MRKVCGEKRKGSLKRTLCALVCLAALFSLAAPALAEGGEIGTNITVEVEERLQITFQTEDFTLPEGGSQMLMVTAAGGCEPYTFTWTCSTDGGGSWFTPAGATDAASYSLTDAQLNTPVQTPYIYRVTVDDVHGNSTFADIRVLVSSEYAYRTITLRDGFLDVSAYMHNKTRLVVTPLGDSTPAAVELQAELSPGCLPLLICDVSLVNQNNQVVPYFGAVEIKFHVGAQYNGQTLKAFHLYGGSIASYSGTVTSGLLSVTVNALSPFMVEAAAAANGMHTVTASAGTGGGISPSGRINAAHGADKTFTFLPDAGYAIDRVRVNNASVSFTGNSYRIDNITADTAIDVSFRAVASSYTMHKVTATSGPNGTVSPSGTIRVRHGAAQTFYFYPAPGYELDTLLINGVSVNVLGSSYTISAVEKNTTVAATFRTANTQRPDVYRNIHASAGAGGSISPAGDVWVEYGGGMYFYFIPYAGYTLDKVLVDGVATAVTGSRYHFINVTASHTIRAVFKRVNSESQEIYYTVTASSGENGSISPSGSVAVAEGSSQTFSLIADEGSEIDTLFVDGMETDFSGNAFRFTDVRADHTIHVTYKQSAADTTYYTITATAGENGSISPSGSVQIARGSAADFSFIPDEGYAISEVLVDSMPAVITDNAYRFENVNAEHSIRVRFEKIETAPGDFFSVSVSAGEHGSVSPSGAVQVAAGGSQTFYFIPDEGYAVEAIYLNGEKLDTAASQYTVENIGGDLTISVTFKPVSAVHGGWDCHCLWKRLFGNCAICSMLGRCIAPWCFLIPLLLLAAAGVGVWLAVRKKKNR